MSKSAKLYKDSPEVKKDKDGKPGISRPSQSTGEGMGTEGSPLPEEGAEGEMPIQLKQVHDMHERHISEMKDMHKRHLKEHEKLAAEHSGTNDASEEVAGKGAE